MHSLLWICSTCTYEIYSKHYENILRVEVALELFSVSRKYVWTLHVFVLYRLLGWNTSPHKFKNTPASYVDDCSSRWWRKNGRSRVKDSQAFPIPCRGVWCPSFPWLHSMTISFSTFLLKRLSKDRVWKLGNWSSKHLKSEYLHQYQLFSYSAMQSSDRSFHHLVLDFEVGAKKIYNDRF
jgi:hypothetical protein